MRGILTFKELLGAVANITPENPATEEEREEAKNEAGVCACRVWASCMQSQLPVHHRHQGGVPKGRGIPRSDVRKDHSNMQHGQQLNQKQQKHHSLAYNHGSQERKMWKDLRTVNDEVP